MKKAKKKTKKTRVTAAFSAAREQNKREMSDLRNSARAYMDESTVTRREFAERAGVPLRGFYAWLRGADLHGLSLIGILREVAK